MTWHGSMPTYLPMIKEPIVENEIALERSYMSESIVITSVIILALSEPKGVN